MTTAPSAITLRTPYRSISTPTSGDRAPLITAAMANPPEMAARLQPKCPWSGTRKTGGA
jgi:hypothetical protein